MHRNRNCPYEIKNKRMKNRIFNRKEFLILSARYALLSIFVFLGGMLLVKKKINGHEKKNCAKGHCDSCPDFVKCEKTEKETGD